MGIDISSEAITVARKNILDESENVDLVNDSIEKFKTDKMFDVIVSNPPYIPISDKKLVDSLVLDNEPKTALFTQDDPLYFYRQILVFAKKNLNEAQKKAISNVKLQDVCNFYLGTLVQEDDPVLNRQVTANLILIDRDTALPATKSSRLVTLYYDQESISIDITQSEGRERNREFVNIIHQGELKFPDKKPKGRPINVTYTYDTSGKLHCIFEDEATKEKYEVSIRPESAEDLRKNYEAIEHIVIE